MIMSFGMFYRIVKYKINEFKIMFIVVNVKILYWIFWLIKKSIFFKWILKIIYKLKEIVFESYGSVYDIWRIGKRICLIIIEC